MEIVNDILTLAYFPFIENLSNNQLSQWQREVKAPSGRNLNSREHHQAGAKHHRTEQDGYFPQSGCQTWQG